MTLMKIILGILCSLFGTSCLLSSFVYLKYYKKRKGLMDTKQILYGTVNASVSPNSSLKIYR
jgi:hypothetical protein